MKSEDLAQELKSLLINNEAETHAITIELIKFWQKNSKEIAPHIKIYPDLATRLLISFLNVNSNQDNPTAFFSLLSKIHKQNLPLNEQRADDWLRKNVPSFDAITKEGVDYLFAGDAYKAQHCFQMFCKKSFQEGVIYRGIFRVYCNLGLTYIETGNKDQALKYLRMSHKLNPRYSLAKHYIDKIISQELDKRMSHSLWDLPDYLDLDEVITWEEDVVLEYFEFFGVSFNKDEVTKFALKSFSRTDICEKFINPYFEGIQRNEDFIWMGAMRLLRIWCPEKNFVEDFEEVLEDELEEDVIDTTRGLTAMEYLTQVIKDEPKEFFTKWKSRYLYQNGVKYLLYFLFEDYLENKNEEVLDLLIIMQEKTSDNIFDQVKKLNELKKAYDSESEAEIDIISNAIDEIMESFQQDLPKQKKDIEDLLAKAKKVLEGVTAETNNTPADDYYDFLQKTKIDFSTKEDPTPEIAKMQNKVGRNAPCPCGSGKKYKKCCL